VAAAKNLHPASSLMAITNEPLEAFGVKLGAEIEQERTYTLHVEYYLHVNKMLMWQS
jgi:hypothetical protein